MKVKGLYNKLLNNLRNVGKSIRNNPHFLLFVVFSVVITLKLIWYHGTVLTFEDCETLGRTINRFIAKVSVAIFISSFVFLSKKSWWTIIIAIAIDVWMIANVIYYRACGFFINAEAMQMADNMNGFWSSIFIYFSWKELIPVLITALYTVFVLKSKRKVQGRSISFFVFVLLFVFGSRCGINFVNHKNIVRDALVKKNFIEVYRPILDSQYDAYRAARNYFIHGTFDNWEKRYITRYSIADFFLANVSYFLCSRYYAKKLSDIKYEVPITDSDKEILKGLIKVGERKSVIQTNLVLILFESLEGWVFEEYEGSEHIAPNLKKIIDKENSLFVPCVKSQTKQGNSGDGQLIALTGLLPLNVGAACRLYGKDSYPNYAHFFGSSATVNPVTGAWNQSEVNPNYGIKQLLDFKGTDEDMIDSLIAVGDSATTSFFLLGITIASHSPFKCEEFARKPSLPSDMPKTLQNYLTCLNYTDRVLGKLISKIENDPKWMNTTLVVTGDHTIFQEQKLEEFSEYANKANISLKDKKNYVPLIIYSPLLTSKVRKDDVYYQADIYPTVLDLIGAGSYYWKGVGRDILSEDSTDRMDEETGYRISDALIRNNFFEKFRDLNK